MTQKAVVVLSGGQDSTVCLYYTLAHVTRAVTALSFDYGQRHRVELECAAHIARAAHVDHHILKMPDVLGGTSPLVSGEPLETYTSFAEMDRVIGTRVEKTFVPMRNALFLSIAAAFAFNRGALTLVTGVCESDNANYPDCREAFIVAQERAIQLALGVDEFSILTPLMHATKADTVRMARALPGCWPAMALTHTCYAGVHPGCGMCHACVLRAEGFAQAGLPDPLFEVAA